MVWWPLVPGRRAVRSMPLRRTGTGENFHPLAAMVVSQGVLGNERDLKFARNQIYLGRVS